MQHSHGTSCWMNVFDGDVLSGKQVSFPLNLTCCSEQMNIPECINVIMNIMPPNVSRNMIVMVWAVIHHVGCRDGILQHYLVPLINITGGIFQHDSARPHTAQVCWDLFYTKTTFICLTVASNIKFIYNRTPLIHPGSQSSSKEPSATNTTWTFLDFAEWMAKHPSMHHWKSCLHVSLLYSCESSTRRK